MSKNIVKLKFSEQDQFNLRPYGTCSTEAATAAKVVMCPDFVSLVDGATVLVKFTNSNDADATLNVNSTGAKSIINNGVSKGIWDANEIVEFIYNGIAWEEIRRNASSSTNPSVACTSLTLSQGTATTPSGDTVEVIENKNITASGTGTSLSGTLTAVTVPTKEYTDKTFATITQVNDYTQVIAGSLVDLNDRLSYHTLDIERRYLKPSTGIPFTDLSESLQTSLNNADTAFGWGDHNNKYLSLAGGTVTGNIIAQSFSIPSGSNDHVLLAGGGTKSLAEVVSETDPVFGASPASDVTTDHITTLNDLAGGKITINNDSNRLKIVDDQDKEIASFGKGGFTNVDCLLGEEIELMYEADAGWGYIFSTGDFIELYKEEWIDDTSPDANTFYSTITSRGITLSEFLIEDDISQETTVAPSGITTPSVLLPEGALELYTGAVWCENSEININGGSLCLAESTPITFNDDDVLSFVDGNNQIITNLDKNGITTTTLSADKIQLSGGIDDFVLLAGGGVKQLDDLATKSYVSVAIAKAELSGGDVDLSGYATKDDLSTLAKKSDLNGYLPLSGGTLSGDLIIQRGESVLSLSNCELYFNNGGGITCDDPTSVNFYGFESSLCFDEDGSSKWTSQVSTIHSDELTIGGVNGSEALIYLGHGQSNIISTADQDVTLQIRSSERINLQAEGDGIYLNAPSVGFGEIMDVSTGRVILYNDTRLDFTGESGTTAMGPTENGFIISNDGELQLEGDSIVINSADSIYFSTSSDTTFDSRVYITNDVHAQAFYETSDARKKDIKSDLSLDKCYDLIDKCQTVIYSLKDQTKEQVGMIAQEIEEFFPEVVATDEEGFKSLAYDRLVVICFKVLKDVIKRLEKLEDHGNE